MGFCFTANNDEHYYHQHRMICIIMIQLHRQNKTIMIIFKFGFSNLLDIIINSRATLNYRKNFIFSFSTKILCLTIFRKKKF